MNDYDFQAASHRPFIVRPAQAARLIGVSRQQLYRMLNSGELDVPRVAISQHVRGFRVADLERWVDRRPVIA